MPTYVVSSGFSYILFLIVWFLAFEGENTKGKGIVKHEIITFRPSVVNSDVDKLMPSNDEKNQACIYNYKMGHCNWL